MAKAKKAFGGYSINFKGCTDSMESVFGGTPIGPSDMTKKIWAYVKRKKLAGKRQYLSEGAATAPSDGRRAPDGTLLPASPRIKPGLRGRSPRSNAAKRLHRKLIQPRDNYVGSHAELLGGRARAVAPGDLVTEGLGAGDVPGVGGDEEEVAGRNAEGLWAQRVDGG